MTVEAIARAQAQGAREKEVLEVDGGRARVSLDSLRELWLYREVWLAFALRTIKVRYKQAALGTAWAVVQPVAAAGLFAVFLGRLSHLKSEGAPYFVFALAGMVGWSYFSNATGQAMNSLVDNGPLLRKVYFPREVLPLASLTAALVDLVPALAVLVVVAAAEGIYPTAAWVSLPLPLLLVVVSAAALAFPAAALNVYYRDVKYVLPFILQVGLFACPVAYSLSVVPSGWRTPYEVLNPLAAVIDSLRRIVLHGRWPEPGVFALASGWALFLLVCGYVLFKRVERGYADRI